MKHELTRTSPTIVSHRRELNSKQSESSFQHKARKVETDYLDCRDKSTTSRFSCRVFLVYCLLVDQASSFHVSASLKFNSKTLYVSQIIPKRTRLINMLKQQHAKKFSMSSATYISKTRRGSMGFDNTIIISNKVL